MTEPLHTFPDAEEIVTAVREFLESEVVPGTDGPLSFHARVAARLLTTLERELGAGPEPERRFHAALATWSVRDETELAEHVLDGRLGLTTPGLVEALLEITRDRLAVSNPGHADDPVDDDPRT